MQERDLDFEKKIMLVSFLISRVLIEGQQSKHWKTLLSISTSVLIESVTVPSEIRHSYEPLSSGVTCLMVRVQRPDGETVWVIRSSGLILFPSFNLLIEITWCDAQLFIRSSGSIPYQMTVGKFRLFFMLIWAVITSWLPDLDLILPFDEASKVGRPSKTEIILRLEFYSYFLLGNWRWLPSTITLILFLTDVAASPSDISHS